MVPCRQDAVIDLNRADVLGFAGAVRNDDLAAPFLPVGGKPGGARDHCVNPCGIAGSGNHFLPIAALGEHAQIQHRAAPIVKIDNHIGIVENVGPLPIL